LNERDETSWDKKFLEWGFWINGLTDIEIFAIIFIVLWLLPWLLTRSARGSTPLSVKRGAHGN
jgi:hypothetical protein